MKTYKAIIFDFDGTLIDSAPGIMLTLELMMKEMGREPISDETLRACVGPPINKYFQELLGFHGEEIDRAISAYRRIFDEEALPSLCVFPGTLELLHDIKQAGYLTGIATCKLKPVCERQAAALGITPYIDYISGAIPDRGILEKSDVLRVALEELGVSPSDAVMIGDRTFDLIGACEVGTDGIGVMHGGLETLENFMVYGPLAVVDDMHGLRSVLLG